MPAEESILRYAELARMQVLAAWPEIVGALIAKASIGGYQQAKLLIDLFDLSDIARSSVDGKKKQQLCDVLLEGLSLLPGHIASFDQTVNKAMQMSNARVERHSSKEQSDATHR